MKRLLAVVVLAVVAMSSAVFAEKNEQSFEVTNHEETTVRIKPSLHYVPVGIARSWNAPNLEPERDYFFGWMGVSTFTLRMGDGQMLLLGSTFSYAEQVAERPDDSTLYVAFVPAAVRVYKSSGGFPSVYFAVTLGIAEIDGHHGIRLTGYNAVGVQFSLCIAGCK